MSLTVSWGILTLGKIARGMFSIIKSGYVVSCNSSSINREKLNDYLKWTDLSVLILCQAYVAQHRTTTHLVCIGFN